MSPMVNPRNASLSSGGLFDGDEERPLANASTTTVKNFVVSTHPFGPNIPIQSSDRPRSQVGMRTAFVRVALRRPKVRYAIRQFSIVAPLASRHVPSAATVARGGGGAGGAWADAESPICSAARAAASPTHRPTITREDMLAE